VFGVPPLSHEDDPVRGIKTALNIHTELNQQQMDNSIGITYVLLHNRQHVSSRVEDWFSMRD